MNKKIFVTYLLLTLVINTLTLTQKSQALTPLATPNMYVEPSSTTVETGKYFSINISISNVNQLAAWQLKLYYENSILNGTFTTEGPFLKQGGSTFYWQIQLNDQYNTTHGIVELACTIIGDTGGANGSGTLATIMFKSIAEGTTTLHIENTKLSDPATNPIQHTTTDGTVTVFGKHDIAITNLTPLKTIIGLGYTIQINVTVANQGDFAETFNVAVYANTTTIETKELTLTDETSTTITFTWNTTGFVKGNYTISAYAEPVPGETETDDNTYTNGLVYIGLVGDVNADQKVDIRDIFAIALKYGTKVGDPNYDPNMDVDCDNKVDIRDIFAAALHYGEKDP